MKRINVDSVGTRGRKTKMRTIKYKNTSRERGSLHVVKEL